MKEHDLFLDMIANPTFSLGMFQMAGLTADNTGMLDEEFYKNNELVLKKFTDSNGNFDDKKFKTAFQSAKVAYNKFATDTFLDSARELVTYSENNITVPFEKRRDSSEEIQLFKSINPLKLLTGLITLGRTEAPKQTIEEIALNNKVYDSETDSWQSSPNDSFFDNFFETRVLALYEEDGYHNDPITGEKIKHTKGEFKLNEDGQYYYENLNGRSVAGKIVLNKLNTITRDGSKFNKYDFFDSDDLEKSLGGTLLKNIALVAPMFIPYIGPVYTGASIAVNSANFLSVLGKMFVGSDSTVLNDIEGFTESFNRQGLKSDYAKNNTWCWENFINLAGDVTAQLKEQRFLFLYVPALFKGKIGLTKENLKEAIDKWANDYFKSKMATIDDDMAKKSAEILNTKGKKITFNRAKVESEYLANSRGFAENKMQDFMKSYNSIGGTISKAYMTGITVNDMYGEAKLAGASDFEATLLTLGYAAAEYALLSTDIGSHIIPEINNPKFRNKAIALALKEKATENTTINSMSKLEKLNWVKKLFNKGKEIAQLDYTKGGRTLPSLFSHGFAESVEETSEEFLADFSRSCYNLTQWLQGDESRLKAFDNILDRYAMSAIGGFVGGGINGIAMDSNISTGKLSYNQAIQELTYKVRNKEIDSFLKFLDKTTIADKNLSFTKFIKDDSGNIIYDAAQNKEDSWDFNVKKAIKNLINLIDNILSAEGANISDDSFLTQQTLGDIRFNALINSNVAGKYLLEFNSTTINLMESLLKLDGISKIDFKTGKLLTDLQKRNKEENDLNTEIENQKIKELKEDVEKYRKLKDDFITGKKAPEFIRDALFEMSPVLNYYFTKPTFLLYAEYISKKSFEAIPEKEREELKKKYAIWLETEAKDDIHSKAEMFEEILHKFSKVISEHKGHIETNNDEITLHLSHYYEGLLNTEDISFLSNALSGLLNSYSYTNILALLLDSKLFDLNLSKFNNERKTLEENKELNDEDKEKKLKTAAEDFLKSSQDIIVNNIDSLVKKYIDLGYINKEVKNGLLKVINTLIQRYLPNIYDEGFGINAFNGNDATNNTEEDTYTKLISYNKKINELKESSIIEEFINKASINITDKPINILTILNTIQASLNSNINNLELFILEEDTYEQLKEALSVIHIYKSAIEASKNDNVSFQTQFNNEGFIDTSELWGFNKTLNEINEKNKTENWEKLPELDSNTANLILQDINIIYNKLNSVKNLYELALGLKITKLNRVTSNTNYLLYNKIKAFSSYIPDDWKNKDKLLEALNAETLKKYSQSRNLSISDSEQEELLKERFLIEDAIYDFFQSNLDKIKDIKELKRIINSKNYNLLENPTEILTESLENLDDNSFIYYLASRAAVKASDFYYKYKLILPKNIAPFATQELATYLNYAYAVNGSVINQFFKAFQESSVEAFENLNTLEREKLGINGSLTDDKYKSFSKVFGLSPVFDNLIFTEGIPGSGKTGAVFNLTILMLKKFNPEILENVIFAHGANKESMEEYVKGMEMNTDNVMSKLELMKFISSSYIDIKSIKDEKKRQEKLKELFTIVDNLIKSTFKINKLSKKPTLLIIDEITNFNYLELDAINEFCKEYGIAALIAGDFDQTGESERLPIDDIKEFEGAKGISFNLAATRNLFVRTPKLGVSLRTANSQKTNNILLMLSIFQNNSKGKINLHYYEKDNTLLGDKFFMLLNHLEQDLDRYIIPNLKEDEKIGYIYHSEESNLYKLLTSDKYKDKVSLYKNNEAQGKEGDYYIVELSPEISGKPALLQLYTGISRSKVTSLIYLENNENLKGVGNIVNFIDNMTTQERFPIEQIEKFSNSYIKLLELLFKEEPKVTYLGIKSKSNKKSSNASTSDSDTDTSNDSDSSDDTDTDTDDDSDSDNDSDEDEGTDDTTDTDEDTDETSDEEPEGVVKEIVTSSGNVSFKNDTKEKETSDKTGDINKDALKGSEKQKKKYQAPTSNKTTTNTNTTNTDSTTSTKSTTNTSNVEPFPIDLYSYNTYTLGIPKNSEGKLCYIENGELKVITNNTPIDSVINSERFDNLHGLARFIPKLENESTLEYINRLDNALSLVRKVLLHTEEKAGILKFFNSLYGADNLDITFAIKNRYTKMTQYSDTTWANLFFRPNEYLEYNTSSLSHNPNPNKPSEHDNLIARNLVAIVYEKNPKNGIIKKVEIPLLSITSPISIINQTDSKGNVVNKNLHDIYINPKNKDDAEALNKVKASEDCPQGLKNLIELYLNIKNNIFYFDSEVLGKDFASWTPAKAAESYGMELSLTKGKKSLNAIDYLLNISIKLSDLSKNKTMYISKIMVYSLEGGYKYRNNTITAGHPFILVSDHPDYLSYDELLALFEKQAGNNALPEYVKLIYVLPPKATFEEYILNLHEVMNGGKRNVKPLGQINTSYIILRELYNNGTLETLSNNSKKDTKNTVDLIIDILKRINTTDSNTIIKSLKGKDDTKSFIVYQELNRLLLNLVSDQYSLENGKFYTSNTINEGAIKTLVDSLKDINIYYSTRLPKQLKRGRNDFVEIITDRGTNYQIDGRDYTIACKMDSSVFNIDMGEIIHNILNEKTYTSGPFKGNSKDLTRYVKGDYSLTPQKFSKIRNLLAGKTKIDLDEIANNSKNEELFKKKVINTHNLSGEYTNCLVLQGKDIKSIDTGKQGKHEYSIIESNDIDNNGKKSGDTILITTTNGENEKSSIIGYIEGNVFTLYNIKEDTTNTEKDLGNLDGGLTEDLIWGIFNNSDNESLKNSPVFQPAEGEISDYEKLKNHMYSMLSFYIKRTKKNNEEPTILGFIESKTKKNHELKSDNDFNDIVNHFFNKYFEENQNKSDNNCKINSKLNI